MIGIYELGSLIAAQKYRYSSEKDLQNALESLFTQNNISYEREFRLSKKDIVDFLVQVDIGSIGLEIKIDGTRNALLRQINRYLSHEQVLAIFVIGSPHWINNLPNQLNNKDIYCHRILTGIF